jgi:hypothetical protein
MGNQTTNGANTTVMALMPNQPKAGLPFWKHVTMANT